MTDNWDSYFCDVEDMPASIVVNLGLAGIAPIAEYPVLGYVSICLTAPDADGFPGPEEEERLASAEDALVGALDASGSGCCAGHCLSDGRLDILFYLREETAFPQCLEKTLADLAPLDWQAGTHPDPDWNLYFQFLYPDAQTLLLIQNRRVRDRLQEMGDDLTKSRRIEHLLEFACRAHAEDFAQAVRELGYRVEACLPATGAEDEEGETGRLRPPAKAEPQEAPRLQPENADAKEPGAWQIRLSRLDPPEATDDLAIELFILAQNFHGSYNGWTCPVDPA